MNQIKTPRVPNRPRLHAIAGLAVAVLLGLPAGLRADQVPNPAVTASAKPYSGAYTAGNMFLPGKSEFATASQGPCNTPLTTDPANGTWVELDFGKTVTFDRFILATRNNTVDVAGTNQLYIGNDPVHSTNDTIFTFSAAGANGSAPINTLGAISGRYVRWEVLSGKAGGNLGGRHMWFLNTPANMTPLSPPAVISATAGYNGTYAPTHATDGKCGNDNSGEEYAINGGVSGATNTVVVFDFGTTNLISGFDFLNREGDLNTSFTLTFSDDPTFANNLATNSFTANATNGNAWNTATFSAIAARYIQFQSTGATIVGSAGTPNPGMREMVFYGPGGQPPVIAQNPQSVTNYVDDLITIPASASGSLPLFYQWLKNGAPIIGATNNILTLANIQPSSAGDYALVVTNLYGRVTSVPAILTVTNPPVNLQAGLVAYYTFDETNGTVANDSSTNGYSATLYNYPDTTSMWGPGRIGGALAFNVLGTSNEYVLTDNPLQFADTNDFTFSFWEKLGGTYNPNNPRLVVPVGADYWVLWSPNIGVGFYPPAQSPGPQSGVWTHFVVTYNRLEGSYGLFVNGVKVLNAQSDAYIKPVTDLQSQWVFGHSENLSADSDSWRGYMDDLHIYNRIIYPSEAVALYHLAVTEPPTFTVAPQSQQLFVGQALNLSAVVNGTTPIAYQWQRNGTNIPGAVGEQLLINNVQVTDSGSYTLIASNIVQTATATAVITVSPVTSVTNGLAGYWKFDETTGATVSDSSGLGDNGTVLNNNGDGGQWTTGLVGGALDFRGPGSAADYVEIPIWPVSVNGSMTFSAWVMAQAETDPAAIACGGSGADGTGQFVVGISAAGNLYGSVEDTSALITTVQDGTALPTNEWEQVVLVANGNKVFLYRNGLQVGSASFSGSLFNPTNAMSLGGLLTADGTALSGRSFQGLMDEAAYWTRGLSAGEVFELYAAGRAGDPVTGADAFANSPPIIASQPAGGTAYLHDPFSFQVGAEAASALAYQWSVNGKTIANATNQIFTLPVTEFTDAGSYSVVITAATGSVTSAPAVLTITAPLPAPDSGLVLYLTLDDAAGSITAADESTNHDAGNLVNFPSPVTNWIPGIINGGLLLNQAPPNSDAIAVPDVPALDFGASPFSLSLWVKGPAAQTASGGIICKGLGGGSESYCIDLFNPAAGTPYFRFFTRDSSGATPGTRQIQTTIGLNGEWQHIAVIGDAAANQCSMYVDGVFAGSAALSPDGLLANGDTLDIGARQFNGGYTLPFIGELDDVRVYGRAITSLEVRALYYQGAPPQLEIAHGANGATVSWPFETIGTYQLQSSPTLAPGAWTAVSGVTTNYVNVTPAGSSRFYRLVRSGNGE